MTEDLQKIRDAVLTHALPNIMFDGWTMAALEAGAMAAGYERTMVRAVFPRDVADAIDHLADFADRQMLTALKKSKKPERVRDRVLAAVLARFDYLSEVREAEVLALRWRAMPRRKMGAAKALWRTADRIWDYAGDTATDYNRYTKRMLLSGVLAATALAWLQDSETVPAFAARRIENVMQLGQFLGRIRPNPKHLLRLSRLRAKEPSAL